MLRRWFVPLGICLTLLLGACGSDGDSTNSSGNSTESPGSGSGGEDLADTLRIGTTGIYTMANPLELPWASFSYAGFDMLLRAFPDSPLEPRLATEWEFKSDTLIEFKIREGVTFHNGEPVTAEDAAFSLNLSKGEGFATSTSLDTFVEARAIDDQTLEVEMSVPDAIALQKLSMVPIIPKAYWEEVGATGFNANPVGSGPYKVTMFSADVGADFERNPDFWGEAAKTEKIELRYFTDPEALQSALESGQIDIAHGLPLTAIQTIGDDDNYVLETGFGGGTQMFQINTTKPPFDDADLRRAINMAVDQDALIESLTYGVAVPEDGQVTFEGVNGYRPDIHSLPFDPDEAKKLVEASDYDGTPIVISGSVSTKVMEPLAAALSDIGIKSEIIQNDIPVWLEEFRNGSDANIFFRGVSYTGIYDASRTYRWFTYSDKPFVTDPEWIELWEAQASEMDPEARTAILEEATKFIHDNNYVLFTYANPQVGGSVKQVSGIEWYGVMFLFDEAVKTQ